MALDILQSLSDAADNMVEIFTEYWLWMLIGLVVIIIGIITKFIGVW